MATIVPDPDEFQATVKALLDLSDRPRDLKIVTVPAIDVPDHVAERYERYRGLGQEEAGSEEPKKRGPGRPRKNPVSEESA